MVHGEHETRSRPDNLAVHSQYVCAQSGANTMSTTTKIANFCAPAHLGVAEGVPSEIQGIMTGNVVVMEARHHRDYG